MKINPYLNFNGNTEDAFNFYKSVFGGEFSALQRFRDTSIKETIEEDDLDKIMHIALPIGEGNILMGTDALESMGQELNMGDNFSISIEVDSVEEANELFKKLVKGGEIEMPLEDTFWNAYFGILEDKFEVRWIISYTYPKK